MKRIKGLAGITILFFMLIAVAGLDGDFDKKEQSVFGALSDEEHPKIALTFDDGPHPVYTEELLDGLKKRKVMATFFLIGNNILMHDIFETSVQAAFQIIDTLEKENYEFVTVDELLLE